MTRVCGSCDSIRLHITKTLRQLSVFGTRSSSTKAINLPRSSSAQKIKRQAISTRWKAGCKNLPPDPHEGHALNRLEKRRSAEFRSVSYRTLIQPVLWCRTQGWRLWPLASDKLTNHSRFASACGWYGSGLRLRATWDRPDIVLLHFTESKLLPGLGTVEHSICWYLSFNSDMTYASTIDWVLLF